MSSRPTAIVMMPWPRSTSRYCGGFITFEIILLGGDGPFWLRLRDDKKTKEFLKDMFGVDAAIGGS